MAASKKGKKSTAKKKPTKSAAKAKAGTKGKASTKPKKATSAKAKTKQGALSHSQQDMVEQVAHRAKDLLIEKLGDKAEGVGTAIREEGLVQALGHLAHHDKAKAPAASASSATGMADALRELKGLLDDGIITQQDFDAKKKQLLGL